MIQKVIIFLVAFIIGVAVTFCILTLGFVNLIPLDITAVTSHNNNGDAVISIHAHTLPNVKCEAILYDVMPNTIGTFTTDDYGNVMWKDITTYDDRTIVVTVNTKFLWFHNSETQTYTVPSYEPISSDWRAEIFDLEIE